MNARYDPCCRYRHPSLRDADFLHQQPRRFHEIFVVQERLAHAHENQVDAIFGWRYFLIFEHRTNLTRDLTRRQISLYPQQRRQTELAIDSTSHLTGNTNRRPPLILPLPRSLIPSLVCPVIWCAI